MGGRLGDASGITVDVDVVDDSRGDVDVEVGCWRRFVGPYRRRGGSPSRPVLVLVVVLDVVVFVVLGGAMVVVMVMMAV